MRYRYSRAARLRMMEERNQRGFRFLYVGLSTAIFVLVAFALWILLFERQARAVADWLLDRPVPAAFPEFAGTAAFKSDEQAYYALDSALYGALINLQVKPERIRDTKPRAMTGAGQWTPVERRITVSGAYSLTECNLEIARAVARAGGTIVRAAERSRSRELLLEIAHEGKVTHRLYVARDVDLARKKGRLAVVVVYSDGDYRGVVEQLSEFSRPVTFALLPWAPGARELANDAARRNHEVIALLPVQPRTFTRNVPRRRSVLTTHTDATNRRIVEDALASLSTARGVLAYPGSLAGAGVDVPDPVLDVLDKRDKYYLDHPGKADSSHAPDNRGDGPDRIRAWGVLDRIYNPAVISMNLDRASLSALDEARAVVIAYARPHTLQVLMNQVARLELRGIEFVRVSELLDN